MRHRIWLIGAALLASGCNVVKAPNAETQSATAAASPISEADAQKTLAAVAADYQSGDAAKIMAHYAPGAAMFDAAHATLSSDRNQQLQWATQFVGIKPADLVPNVSALQRLDGDTFVASGTASFTGDINGHRDVLHSRYTQVFQKQPDGRWLIVAEHMSLPPEQR